MGAAPAIKVSVHDVAPPASVGLQRLDTLLDVIKPMAPLARVLSVGCATPQLVERLAPLCRRLHVVDADLAVLSSTAGRLGRARNIAWQAVDVTDGFDTTPRYDLIVVADALHRLPNLQALRRAISVLSACLFPGGVLVFAAAAEGPGPSWGRACGPDVAMAEWKLHLRETGRKLAPGDGRHGAWLAVSYRRDPDSLGG